MNRLQSTALLSFLLTSTLSLSAFAHDGADALVFPQVDNISAFQLPSARAPGDVIWESGPSQPAPSPFEAILIQGTLKGTSASEIVFQAAIKTASGWSDWTEGKIVASYPNGRFWARVRSSGAAGDVARVRVIGRGPSAAGSLEIYGVETKAAAGADADAPAPADSFSLKDEDPLKNAAALPPGVLPREAWGAKPIRAPHRFEPMRGLRLTVHHTEGAQPMNREDAIHELQAIQSFHQNGRGWNDIAYHYLIDGTGQVWQGRPEGVVGSHVLARNDGSIGIVLMGSFHPPKNQQPTEAQLRSLVALLRYLSAEHQIPVTRIFGHREQEPGHGTDCPGNILFAKLPEIRKQVAQASPSMAPRLDPIRLDGPALRTLLQEVRQ